MALNKIFKKTFSSQIKQSFLSLPQINFFSNNGYLVLPDLISKDKIDELVAHTNKRINSDDIFKYKTIFETSSSRGEDFINSGDRIQYFFEPGVFDKDNNLKYPKEISINKIGHAMHDLDKIYEKFSYKLIKY